MDKAEHSADSKERLIPEVQAERMSLRPPFRFKEATDLVLWLTRFEIYVTQAEIPERRWTEELLPLLAGSVQACFATRPGGFGELAFRSNRQRNHINLNSSS